MIVVFFPDLHEQDFPAVTIDDGLPSAEMPPFDRVVELPSGHDDPVGNLPADDVFHQRWHGLLRSGEANIPSKLRLLNLDAKHVVQVFDEVMMEMDRPLIRKLD